MHLGTPQHITMHPCTTHARRGLPVIPDPQISHHNLSPVELQDTAVIVLLFSLQQHSTPAENFQCCNCVSDGRVCVPVVVGQRHVAVLRHRREQSQGLEERHSNLLLGGQLVRPNSLQ